MTAKRRKVAVIVGGGVAGATCAAETAALTSDDVEVVLVSPSPVVRVATAGALRCEVEVADAPADAWARAARVRVVRAAAVGLHARSVALAGGGALGFDVCCVATGARPRLPAAAGDSLAAGLRARVLTVRDTDSVETMRRAVAGARRVVVVGNGGIALELAHELGGGACEVVWAIREDHVGNSFFDARAGDVLFQFLRRGGRGGGPGGGAGTTFERTDTVSAAVEGSVDGARRGADAEAGAAAVLGSGAGPDWLGRRERPILFDKDGKEEGAGRQAAAGDGAAADDTTPLRRAGGALRIERRCEVTRIAAGPASGGWPVSVELSNAAAVLCDLVICATGVDANVEWMGARSRVPVSSKALSDSGGAPSSECSGGVLVSAGSMQSCGRRDVFAAGDCATIVRGGDMGADSGNDWFQMRLWTQAAATARAAAASMAAALGPDAEAGLGMAFELFAHATRFFGKRVVLLGRYNAQGLEAGYEIVEGRGENHFIRVVVERGRVRGALLIGDADLSETYENLILDRLDVSHIALAELVDPSVDLEDYFD